MDIIINKPQLFRAVLLYLNKNFGSLTQRTSSEHPNSVFYVDSNSEVLMECDKENNYVWIHYCKIWTKIQSLFYLNRSDIQSIMQHWLEETYKLKCVTPEGNYPIVTTVLEEDYKLKGIIPQFIIEPKNIGWRRITN